MKKFIFINTVSWLIKIQPEPKKTFGKKKDAHLSTSVFEKLWKEKIEKKLSKKKDAHLSTSVFIKNMERKDFHIPPFLHFPFENCIRQLFEKTGPPMFLNYFLKASASLTKYFALFYLWTWKRLWDAAASLPVTFWVLRLSPVHFLLTRLPCFSRPVEASPLQMHRFNHSYICTQTYF